MQIFLLCLFPFFNNNNNKKERNAVGVIWIIFWCNLEQVSCIFWKILTFLEYQMHKNLAFSHQEGFYKGKVLLKRKKWALEWKLTISKFVIFCLTYLTYINVVVIFRCSCLPVFAWQMSKFCFFEPKELLRVSCTW